mmetsp:Transcript_26508/g.36459  ORF Transcript_26508/g.36459 Transcript_26508/m.36459 type:complete len:145 (+) Transcript_26508:507-941(+)
MPDLAQGLNLTSTGALKSEKAIAHTGVSEDAARAGSWLDERNIGAPAGAVQSSPGIAAYGSAPSKSLVGCAAAGTRSRNNPGPRAAGKDESRCNRQKGHGATHECVDGCISLPSLKRGSRDLKFTRLRKSKATSWLTRMDSLRA